MITSSVIIGRNSWVDSMVPDTGSPVMVSISLYFEAIMVLVLERTVHSKRLTWLTGSWEEISKC